MGRSKEATETVLSELRARRAALLAEARQLEAVIGYLGGNGKAARFRGRPLPGQPTVRSLTREFMRGNPRFESSDLIAAVRETLPDAKEPTIRAELSKAVCWGLVVRRGQGSYEVVEETDGC